jgi:hypothetical protein
MKRFLKTLKEAGDGANSVSANGEILPLNGAHVD